MSLQQKTKFVLSLSTLFFVADQCKMQTKHKRMPAQIGFLKNEIKHFTTHLYQENCLDNNVISPKTINFLLTLESRRQLSNFIVY